MAKERMGLGRGLSALLSEDTMETPQTGGTGTGARMVSLTALTPNPDQPRKIFTEDEIDSLAASLRQHGLLQPILVRPNPGGEAEFQIVAGERRWRAAQRAPLHEVPVILREFNDAETLEVGLIENVQRVNLNPLEEAESFQRLIDQFDYTQEKLAETIAKSRSHIANTLRLLKLPDSVRGYLREGKLSPGHVRPLIGHPHAERLASEFVRDGVSARQAEQRANAAREGASPKPARPAKDADTEALEGTLSAAFGSPVQIAHRDNGGGALTIRYSSLEELDGICEKLGVGL